MKPCCRPDARHATAPRFQHQRATPSARFGVGHQRRGFQHVEGGAGFVHHPGRPRELQRRDAPEFGQQQRPQVDPVDARVRPQLVAAGHRPVRRAPVRPDRARRTQAAAGHEVLDGRERRPRRPRPPWRRPTSAARGSSCEVRHRPVEGRPGRRGNVRRPVARADHRPEISAGRAQGRQAHHPDRRRTGRRHQPRSGRARCPLQHACRRQGRRLGTDQARPRNLRAHRPGAARSAASSSSASTSSATT